jgi:hypothetical protein
VAPSRIRNPVAGPRCEARCGPRNASSVSSRIPPGFSRGRESETATSNGFAPEPRQPKRPQGKGGHNRGGFTVGTTDDAEDAKDKSPIRISPNSLMRAVD